MSAPHQRCHLSRGYSVHGTICIVFVTAPTLSKQFVAVDTITKRCPSAVALLVVTAAVIDAPPELTVTFETVTLVSITPLLSIKTKPVAPVRFAPLIVTVVVVFLARLFGAIAEMYGPLVADTPGLLAA